MKKLTPDEQIDHIVQLMIRREWNPGVTHKALAEEWSIGVRQVSERAKRASVAIAHAYPVKEWVTEAVAELDSIQAAAMAEVKLVALGRDKETGEMMYEKVPQPNTKAAIAAIEAKGKLLGAFAPTKTQAVEPDAVANMTPQEKYDAHMKAAEELRAELAKGQQNGVH